MGTGRGTGRGGRFLVAEGLAVGRDRNLPGAEHGPNICYHPIILSSRRVNMFMCVVVLMFCVVGAEMVCVCGARVFVFCADVFHAVAFICLVSDACCTWVVPFLLFMRGVQEVRFLCSVQAAHEGSGSQFWPRKRCSGVRIAMSWGRECDVLGSGRQCSGVPSTVRCCRCFNYG